MRGCRKPARSWQGQKATSPRLWAIFPAKLGETLAALGEKIQNESKSSKNCKTRLKLQKICWSINTICKFRHRRWKSCWRITRPKRAGGKWIQENSWGFGKRSVCQKTVWSREQETFDYEAKLKKDRLKERIGRNWRGKNKRWQERENVAHAKNGIEVSAFEGKKLNRCRW